MEAKGIDVQEKRLHDHPTVDTCVWGRGKKWVEKDLCGLVLPNSSNHITADTDSQSDVLRAAGIGIAENDPTEPVLTLRMWVLGVVFCIVASGLNTLYTLRSPSLTVSASVVLLLAHPLGKLWEMIIPSWTIPLGTWSFSLNPGPFNTKVSLLPHKYKSY